MNVYLTFPRWRINYSISTFAVQNKHPCCVSSVMPCSPMGFETMPESISVGKKKLCYSSLWPISFMRPYKQGQWALHFYSIANFDASWLKWLQRILNEFKWLKVIYQTHPHLESFQIIWNHLSHEATKLSIHTINMQRSLSFFVGSQTQCSCSFSHFMYLNYENCSKIFRMNFIHTH